MTSMSLASCLCRASNCAPKGCPLILAYPNGTVAAGVSGEGGNLWLVLHHSMKGRTALTTPRRDGLHRTIDGDNNYVQVVVMNRLLDTIFALFCVEKVAQEG